MKKIMFNDKYCLTAAVLNGRKTMTRRAVPTKLLQKYGHNKFNDRSKDLIFAAPFRLGEIVAVAQAYKDIIGDHVFFVSSETGVSVHRAVMEREKGWTNKMFVSSEFMPNRIRITDIKMERLQDISEEDCLKEGIQKKSYFPLKPSFPYYFEGGKHKWDNSFSTPRKAFAALIDKVSGKGTWDSNPWVFAYTFELVEERRHA